MAKPSPFVTPRISKLPQSKFRQFLPQGETRPSPHHAHTEKKIRIARKQKKHGQGVGEGGGDTAEAEQHALWRVVERMLGRGGMEIAHRFWK